MDQPYYTNLSLGQEMHPAHHFPPPASSQSTFPVNRHSVQFLLSTPDSFERAESPDPPAVGSHQWTQLMAVRSEPHHTPAFKPPPPPPAPISIPVPVTQPVNEADPAASIVSPPSSSRKKALKAKPQPVLDDPTGNHRRTQFSAKQLLTMARAAQDIDLFTVPRGEKTARQKVFAQKCNKAGLIGSVPLLLERLDEMMQWQADPDKFPALDKLLHKSQLFPCFGAPLDVLCEAKIAAAKLSETQKAKKSQKNKEDKEGGRMIQLMAAARSQKHLTRLLLSSDDDEDSDDAPVIVGDISHTVTENADQGNIRPTVISENTSPATTNKKNVQFDATAAAAPTTPVAPAPTTALGDATNTSVSSSSGKRSAADASFADDEASPTKKPQLLKKTAKNTKRQRTAASAVLLSSSSSFDFAAYAKQQQEAQTEMVSEQRSRWKKQDEMNLRLLSTMKDGNKIVEKGIESQAEGVKSLVGVLAAFLKN